MTVTKRRNNWRKSHVTEKIDVKAQPLATSSDENRSQSDPKSRDMVDFRVTWLHDVAYKLRTTLKVFENHPPLHRLKWSKSLIYNAHAPGKSKNDGVEWWTSWERFSTWTGEGRNWSVNGWPTFIWKITVETKVMVMGMGCREKCTLLMVWITNECCDTLQWYLSFQLQLVSFCSSVTPSHICMCHFYVAEIVTVCWLFKISMYFLVVNIYSFLALNWNLFFELPVVIIWLYVPTSLFHFSLWTQYSRHPLECLCLWITCADHLSVSVF